MCVVGGAVYYKRIRKSEQRPLLHLTKTFRKDFEKKKAFKNFVDTNR
jgi:hypothetical protein